MTRPTIIDDVVEQALQEVFTYANHVDEFLIVKKEILKRLPSHERTRFSTRHPISKKQMTNEFEFRLAARWSEVTGRPVIMPERGEPI